MLLVWSEGRQIPSLHYGRKRTLEGRTFKFTEEIARACPGLTFVEGEEKGEEDQSGC